MRITAVLAAIAISALCICLTPAGVAFADKEAVSSQAESLDKAIDNVLQRRMYQWRMPRPEIESVKKKHRGPIASFFKWLGDSMSMAFKYVGELIRGLIEWLESLVPESSPKTSEETAGWMTPVRLLLVVLLALAAAGLAYGVFRLLKRRKVLEPIDAHAVEVAVPDLTEEDVNPAELPVERWLGMAKQMVDKGDLRLAMRAFYLATLARLGEHELLTIEYHKSNLEYQRELYRRVHDKKELTSAFSNSILHFERVWYGLKKITRRQLDEFAKRQDQIAGFVENEPIV